MDDKNIRIITMNEAISVIYPDRIGREYKTSCLDDEGTREWNIDPQETILGKDHYRECVLIIGKWGTGYDEFNDVKHIILLDKVVRFEELSNDEMRISLKNFKMEKEKKNLEWKPKRIIHGDEFDSLTKRVEALEQLLRET